MTERERARVWWRECAACSEGDAIPDLTADSLHNLNPWIVTPSEKYSDPRAARLEKARQKRANEAGQQSTKSQRLPEIIEVNPQDFRYTYEQTCALQKFNEGCFR